MASLMIQDISKFTLGAFLAVLYLRVGLLEMFLHQCAECAKKHSDFGVRSQNMRLWVKKTPHFLLHDREENSG